MKKLISQNIISNLFYKTHPVQGIAAAGSPTDIYQTIIDSIELPSVIHLPKDSFLMRVKGNSLKDAFIFENDIVIVNPNLSPQNNQLIVVIINNAVLIKRFRKRENIIELLSENTGFNPIIVDENDGNFKIIGVVVGLYRKMK